MQKVEIALALGFFLRKIAFPRMKETTCKKLQEIGGFALAGGCTKKRMKQVVEMIRAARNYRWVAVYKIVKDEFVILADTGNEPPAYPRFQPSGRFVWVRRSLRQTPRDRSYDPRRAGDSALICFCR